MGPFPYQSCCDVLTRRTKTPAYVLLDGLKDPHNFGAIVRSAAALGMNAVLIGKKGQVPVTAAVARSSAGAVNHIPIAQVDRWCPCVQALKNAEIQLVATSPRAAETIDTIDLRAPVAVVLGNEAAGLGTELSDLCDRIVAIPQSSQIDSLNVAASAGILFYEIGRQRRSFSKA